MQYFNYSRSFAALIVTALAAAGASAFGCSAITNTTAIQCKADSECEAIGPDFYGYKCDLASHTCQKVAEDTDLCVAANGKSANQSCIDKFGGDPAICSPKSHKCVRLKSPECPLVVPVSGATVAEGAAGGEKAIADDNAVIVGLFDAVDCCFGLGNVIHYWAEQAYQEVMQVNATGIPQAGGTKRPLVLLTCPEVQPGRLSALARATNHLANELEVPMVIGPILYDDIAVTLSSGLRDAKIPSILPTVFTRKALQALPNPIAPSPLLYDINPEENEWINLYGQLIAKQIEPAIRTELGLQPNEPVKVAMISERALLLKESEPLFEKIVVNGKSLAEQAGGNFLKVSIADTTDATLNPNPQAEINAAIGKIAAFGPHIVIHNTSPALALIELIPMVLAMGSNPGITYKPYHIDYATTAFTVPALSGILAQTGYPKARIFGSMAHQSAEDLATLKSKADGIVQKYGREKGDPVALGPVVYNPPHQSLYDTVWLAAYMISALGNKPLTAENFAATLPLINSADPAAPKVQAGTTDGVAGFAATAAGKPIKFRGITSSMNFESNGTVKYPQIEALCTDEKGYPKPSGFYSDPVAGAIGDVSSCK